MRRLPIALMLFTAQNYCSVQLKKDNLGRKDSLVEIALSFNGDLERKFIYTDEQHLYMIKNVVYDIFIHCFSFELSSILYDWPMTSFYLQMVKEVYEAEYVFKMKLTRRTFLKLICLS